MFFFVCLLNEMRNFAKFTQMNVFQSYIFPNQNKNQVTNSDVITNSFGCVFQIDTKKVAHHRCR